MATRKRKSQSDDEYAVRTTLYVSRLPLGCQATKLQTALQELFGECGRVIECDVPTMEEGIARGFAFIRLQNQSETAAAKAKCDGMLLPGIKMRTGIKVHWALDTRVLYIGDLSPTVTSTQLRKLFGGFGDVVDAQVERRPRELGGGSKLYGFVEYKKYSEALKVQQLLSDHLLLLSNGVRPLRADFAVLDYSVDDGEGRALDPKLVEPPPHFAQPGTLEFDFALKWRELYVAHRWEECRLEEVHRQEQEILWNQMKSGGFFSNGEPGTSGTR